MKDFNIRCTKCTSYLRLKMVKSIIAQVQCPNTKCKHLNNVKVVDSDSPIEDIRYRFDTPVNVF